MAETSDYSQVVELLRAESEAIAKAASRLRAEEVDRVVAILTRCKGKIVLLGVGKSGIIAIDAPRTIRKVKMPRKIGASRKLLDTPFSKPNASLIE